MDNADFKIAKEALQVLVGKELQILTRAGSMGDIGFGALVEKEVRGFDEN